MADKKISQLTALSAANLAPSTDVLAIVDTSATETKKIVAQDLINGVLNVASAVGIGTASPSGKLDVLGGISSTSDWGNVNITSRNAINAANRIYTGLRFQDSGASDAGAIGYAYDGTGYNVQFATVATVGGALTSRMTLDRSGNLGIGTASPTSKLDLVGIMQWQATAGTVLGKLTYSGGEPVVLANTGLGLQFFTNNAFAVKIDSSGNLGLGVTPSTSWFASSKAMQIGSSGAPYMGLAQQTTTTCDGYMLWGARLSGDRAFQYTTTGDAVCAYRQNAGTHNWFTAGSGTAGNTISFTQAMTLDASGNLGIGTTSPVTNLHVYKTTAATSGVQISSANWGSSLTDGMFVGVDNNNSYVYTYENIPLLFATNNTERARITSGGQFLVGKTTYSDTTVGAALAETGATNSTMAASANTTTTHNTYSTGAGAYRFYVGMGGTVYATNTTISAISDQRLKENVRDLDVGLDAVMALKPRKFDWKEGKGQDKKDVRGFIAQEFEQVFPDLIDEWKDPAPEGEEPYKSVRQDLIPVLVKAIQELKAELDAAKVKIAALEAK